MEKPELNSVIVISPVPVISQYLHRKEEFMWTLPKTCVLWSKARKKVHADASCILLDCSIQSDF